MKEEICELLAIADSTIYKFRKEKRPIITFLEKYFTKEDLQEFLEYGTIEKLEFANLQDYGNRVAAFVKVLGELRSFIVNFDSKDAQDQKLTYYAELQDMPEPVPLSDKDDLNIECSFQTVNNEGLKYFALVFAKGEFGKSEDMSIDNFAQTILEFYDRFVQEVKHGKIKSASLGKFVNTFRQQYPKYDNFNEILFSLYQKDFTSLVKQCIQHEPNYLNLAVWFCIQFNLYKYDSSEDITEVYSRVYDPDYGNTLKFDFEKFKNEIEKIRNDKQS